MKRAYVAGTFDTKARELAYIGDCLKAEGLAVTLVDLSTSGESMAGADISARASIRGGEPEETLVRFDGLRLYNPFHLKDFQSVFSSVV